MTNLASLNLGAALPEILLLVVTSLLVLADVLIARGRRIGVDRLALVALLVPLVVLIAQAGDAPRVAFSGMYVADGLSTLLKIAAVIATGVSILYARGYVVDRELFRGEFYTLALFSLLGQMVLMSARNMLVVYLGLELMSLSLYALAALRRESGAATEAAMKYFVLGALSSGFLLYGMSMIYGGAGSLDLATIAQKFAGGQINRAVFVFGVVFIVAGVAFKLGAAPFHMWIPDVYQGSPTAATLLIASAPKLAAFAMAFRLLVDGLVGVAADWQQMLTVLAVLSLAVGNIVALAQTNFKRLLAYSTISQIGFVLLGLLSGIVDGNARSASNAYGAGLFYMVTYVLTTLGTFGFIQLMARRGFEAEELSDLRGLNRRSPWMALVMLILMLSLAGLPPTVGFYAKLVVLGAAINAGQTWLAIVAVLFSLVGAFYYLRVVKLIYFDEPADAQALVPAADARVTFAINGALVLLLGIVPGPLMNACVTAVRQALGG